MTRMVHERVLCVRTQHRADVRRNVELLRSGMCSHVHNRAIHVK